VSLPLNQYQQYVPLTPQEKHVRLQKILALYNEWIAITNYVEIKWRKEVLLDIIDRVDKRKVYFWNFHGVVLSEKNEMALYCFWIIKLAPFFDELSPGEYASVKFAVFLFLKIIDSVGYKVDHRAVIDKEYVQNLFYSFLYRDISKEAIMLAADTLLH
jgi:hypothetical protein